MKTIFNFILFSYLFIGNSCEFSLLEPTPYILTYPPHFSPPIPSPSRNPLTIEGIELGEALFFDTQLSSESNISCATCHIPAQSFSDGKQFSKGHSQTPLARNTPALINLAWSKHFFWDGGVKNLESLAYAALISPHEMNMDLGLLSTHLNNNDHYKSLFAKAFQIDSISSPFIARALAQYLRTLVSADSKYDSVMQNQSEFSPEESLGFETFKKNCAVCHTPPLFTDDQFHNNGISHTFSNENLYASTGRYRITLDSVDLGKFKTPTLRNLTKTAPYMHDGRFKNLKEVIGHYKSVDRNDSTSTQLNINLTQQEEQSLIQFLYSLDRF